MKVEELAALIKAREARGLNLDGLTAKSDHVQLLVEHEKHQGGGGGGKSESEGDKGGRRETLKKDEEDTALESRNACDDTDTREAVTYEGLKAVAAQKFKEKKFAEAIDFYNEACKAIYSDGDSDPIRLNSYTVCKSNAAQCCINLNKFRDAITYAGEALSKDPKSVKTLYRRGLSYLALNEAVEAFVDLKQGLELDPGNTTIKKELSRAVSKCQKSLLDAAKEGCDSTVDALIGAGASSVDIQDTIGNTALIWASRNGHGSIVDSLIRAGTSLDIQDKDGNTALLHASSQGHGSIVDALIRAGASLDKQNLIGGAALILASYNGHGSIVDSLIRAIYINPNRQ